LTVNWLSLFSTENLWNGISQEAQDLISKMLTIDPKKRISAEDAYKDIWITRNAQ
jgi:serine/threonine protein kinase